MCCAIHRGLVADGRERLTVYVGFSVGDEPGQSFVRGAEGAAAHTRGPPQARALLAVMLCEVCSRCTWLAAGMGRCSRRIHAELVSGGHLVRGPRAHVTNRGRGAANKRGPAGSFFIWGRSR